MQNQNNAQAGLDPLLGLQPGGNTADLDQLMQDGIRDVLGGSQGSLLPIPGLPEGATLPIVDQHGHLHLGSLELPLLPGEPDVASQVRDTNCSAPRWQTQPSAPMSEDEVDQDDDDDDDDDELGAGAGGGADAGNETGSSGRPGRGMKRKKAGKGGKRVAAPGMQGRFSGRLGTKEDEKRLAAECRLIGPLLGGAARGEKSLHTLAKLVRAIAAGSVRAHLEAQETEVQDLRAKLLLLSDGDGQQLIRVQDDNSRLRQELAAIQRQVAELEQKLANSNCKLHALGQGAGMAGRTAGLSMNRAGSQPVLQGSTTGTLAFAGTAGPSISLPLPTIVSLPALAPPQPHLMLASAPVATTAAQLGAMQPSMPAMPDATAAAVAAQQHVQVLTAMQPAAQVVVSMTGGAPSAPPVQPLLVQAANGGLQPLAQPTVTNLSGGTLAAAKPTLTGVSDALSGEVPAQQLLPAATQPQLSGPTESGPAAAAADQAAQNLNQQAQHLTVQASLHGQAKTQATSQAQQLASQAQLHAQASVQAAVQAEQLKQTLAAAVLPDTQQAHQAAATVQNLEERAKAHADITTQAVAQARELQEKAQVHATEQAKAMAQANMLQAHAHSLAASVQQLEASAQQATSAPVSPPGTGPSVSGEQLMAAATAGVAATPGVAPPNPMQVSGTLPGLAPVVVASAPQQQQQQQQQPAGSINRSGAGVPDISSLIASAPTDLAAAAAPAPHPLHTVAPQQQPQQAVLAAAPGAAPAAPTTLVPAQLPNGQTVQVVVPQQMVTAPSTSLAGATSGSLGPAVMVAGSLQQQQSVLQQPSLAAPAPMASAPSAAAPMSVAPSTDSAAMQQVAAAQQTAQLQEQLAVLQHAQAQQHAVQQQAAAAAAHHQAAAVAVHEQLMMAQNVQQQAAAAVAAQEQQAAQVAAAQAAQQSAVAAHHQLQQAVATQAHLLQQASAAAAAAAAAQDQVNLAAAVVHHTAQQHAAQQQQQAAQDQINMAVAVAAQQQQQQQQQHAAAVAVQQQQQPQLVVQVDVVPQQTQQAAQQQQQFLPQVGMVPAVGGTIPIPAAASAMLQPTPQSLQKGQSHQLEVKIEPMGSSVLPSSSGNAAMLIEAAALSGSRGTMPSVAAPAPGAAQQPSAAGMLAAPGPEISTGLTPQVGMLELPPGIEAIVPSDQPLTGDPMGLLAAAAMAPVVALPQSHSGLQQHAMVAQPSVISIPHSLSEGLTVGSGSSM